MEKLEFGGMSTLPLSGEGGALALSMGYLQEHGGLRRLKWRWPQQESNSVSNYEKPPFPELEFGLVKAGNLALSGKYIVPDDVEARQTVANQILNGFRQAIVNQVEGQGYFYQPFFVRYALRMADGSAQRMSAPVLMLPWTLIPCVTVATTEASDGSTVVSLSGTNVRYFELRCNVLSGLSEEWKGRVLGVDVYCTAPIATYDAEVASTDGFVTFSQMADANQVAGVWAEDGSSFSEHTIADLGLASAKAWAFMPNHQLEQDIIEAKDFYHLAYLPSSELIVGSTLLIRTVSGAGALTNRKQIADTLDGHYGLRPVSTLSFNGVTHGLGGEVEQPGPLPLRTMMAISGSVASAEAYLTVLSRRDGVEYSTGVRCSARNLGSSFPRYLHVGIPGAYALLIRWGVNEYRLPLIPHTWLSGAYWWGGLSTDLTAPLGEWQEGDAQAWHPAGNVLRAWDQNGRLACTELT